MSKRTISERTRMYLMTIKLRAIVIGVFSSTFALIASYRQELEGALPSWFVNLLIVLIVALIFCLIIAIIAEFVVIGKLNKTEKE